MASGVEGSSARPESPQPSSSAVAKRPHSAAAQGAPPTSGERRAASLAASIELARFWATRLGVSSLKQSSVCARATHFHSNWLMRECTGTSADYRRNAGAALHLSMDPRLIRLAQDTVSACRYSVVVSCIGLSKCDLRWLPTRMAATIFWELYT